MNKTCCECEETKPITDFSFKSKEKKTYQSRCKACHKKYRKKHYLLNQEKYKKMAINKTLEIRERNAHFIYNYLSTHPCVDCGESNPLVLEFDHIDRTNKIKEVTLMARDSWSLKKIKEEIDKCEIRCANCHCIKTRIENNDTRYLIHLSKK